MQSACKCLGAALNWLLSGGPVWATKVSWCDPHTRWWDGVSEILIILPAAQNWIPWTTAFGVTSRRGHVQSPTTAWTAEGHCGEGVGHPGQEVCEGLLSKLLALGGGHSGVRGWGKKWICSLISYVQHLHDQWCEHHEQQYYNGNSCNWS